MAQSPAQVERALEDVFARPEFGADPSTSPVVEWIGRVLEAIFNFLGRLFPIFSAEAAQGTIVGRVALVLLAAAALWVALRFGQRFLARRRARDGSSPAERTAPRASPATAEGWEARAYALAAESRWKEAAMALYQSVLHRLAARGAVHVDPAKTPGDYRRESRRHPESYRILDGFLRQLEPVVFGTGVADERAFERLARAAGVGAGNG